MYHEEAMQAAYRVRALGWHASWHLPWLAKAESAQWYVQAQPTFGDFEHQETIFSVRELVAFISTHGKEGRAC